MPHALANLSGCTLPQGLGCSYSTAGGRKVVLDNMCGEARAGELQALMGPSGSGKTTALGASTCVRAAGWVRQHCKLAASPQRAA
jgi:ABC-type lipoprotein export system ATPase subunit